MDWNLILRGVEILAVILVGLIFRLQIKSQGDLIEKMKTYSDIIDPNKIKDYSVTLEELAVAKVKLTAVKILQEELESGDYDSVFMKISEKEISEELFSFAYSMSLSLNEDQRNKLFKTYFPKFGNSLSYLVQKHNNPS